MNRFMLGSFRKYLMFLSYVGHEFRGVQRQPSLFVKGNIMTVKTIQQTLEDTLSTLFKPRHDVQVFSSSRTDAGVHALQTSVHFKLQKEEDIPPEAITSGLNKYFLSNDIGLRIQSTQLVPESFHAQRHAISRTYLYRLAFRREPSDYPLNSKHLYPIPLSEYKRTYFVQSDSIDITKMKEAASILPGTKDFFSFMGKPSRLPKRVSSIRTIHSLTIQPGIPFMPEYDLASNLYQYWDIICHGQSFLYRQVRRIVGVLIAVGGGSMTMDDVRLLLNKPEESSWNPRAVCAPPWGLYLLKVSYNPLELINYIPPDNDLVFGRATYALY